MSDVDDLRDAYTKLEQARSWCVDGEDGLVMLTKRQISLVSAAVELAINVVNLTDRKAR